MDKIIKFIVVFLMLSVSTPMAMAQNQAGGPKGLTNEEKTELTGTRKQLATIVFAGLAGAILGLSTLSFYGRPQEHLTNIAIGGALGVIAGATYTTYKAATRPYDVYDLGQNGFDAHHGFEGRMAIDNTSAVAALPKLQFNWSF